jgi:hypothetical protein
MCIGVDVVIYIETVVPVFSAALTQQIAVMTADTTTTATATPTTMPTGKLSVLSVAAREVGVEVFAVCVCVDVGVLFSVLIVLVVSAVQLSPFRP